MIKHLVVSNREVENTTYFQHSGILWDYLDKHPEVDTLIFAFWSWIVPAYILERYKVYGLHTGPLLEGKGKGGSPIDNLKALGVKITTLCAFEMTAEIDGGRVLLAMPLYLNCPKDLIIYRISQRLPMITDYITTKQPEIPETFKRLSDAK